MKISLRKKLNKFFDKICTLRNSALCAALAIAAVICVGFSTWVIRTPGITTVAYGSEFAVYSVTDSSDYVTFSDGASGFAYNAVGFYTDDYTISSVGKIAKNITLKGGYIQGFLQGAYRLDVAFYPHGDNVSASDLAFMDGRITFAISYGDKTVTPSVTYSASGESSVKTVASAGIDRDNFTNLGINQTDDILLTITVKLDYASGGETYAKLYNYLLGGGAFVMDATVRLSEGGET